MASSYDPCFRPGADLEWEAEWEAKHAGNWRSLASRFGGSHLYVPTRPLMDLPITLPMPKQDPQPRTLPEDNLSVRAIRELELQLKETP